MRVEAAEREEAACADEEADVGEGATAGGTDKALNSQSRTGPTSAHKFDETICTNTR